MRVCIGLLLVASVACKKKADSPASTGSATGSATVAVADATVAVTDATTVAVADAAAAAPLDAAVAAPTLPAFCVSEDDADNATFETFTSTDKAITFCFTLEETKKCAVVDLAAGTFAAVAAPAEPPFKPRAPIDIAKLALPKGHEWSTATSPDGKTIAATTDIESQLFIVDAVSGKLRKTVTWKADGGCMESPSFIGDNIYVQYNVCAGPGATGWIVSPDGKKLGSVEYVNPTGNYYSVGGTRYAFESFDGGTIEIVDGKTGKHVKKIEIEKPEDCEDCPMPRTGGLALEALPGGKLVQFTSFIAVVDPATSKIDKVIKWPVCAKKP